MKKYRIEEKPPFGLNKRAVPSIFPLHSASAGGLSFYTQVKARRAGPKLAQGGANVSLASICATLGCEDRRHRTPMG